MCGQAQLDGDLEAILIARDIRLTECVRHHAVLVCEVGKTPLFCATEDGFEYFIENGFLESSQPVSNDNLFAIDE